jgi:hypothetical protein
MHAAIVATEKLLHGSSVYLIPHFQRSYSWGKKQWQRLWDDVLALAADHNAPSHFIGPLVCRQLQRGPGDSIGRFEVIDGQQRLTTISILLGAMRDHARSEKEDDSADQIHEDYLVHHRRLGNERFKLVPRLQDRRVWNALVERAPHAPLPAGEASVIDEAWNWFAARVASLRFLGPGESSDPSDPDFRSVLEAVVQRLAFVSITIDDDNPYRVFESLNTTGLALSEFDLVRNHLFMQVPLDDQERFEADAWAPFERLWADAVGAGGNAERVATRFLHDFLTRSFGRFKRGEIFIRFRRWADDQIRRGDTNPYDIVRVLAQFAEHANRFRSAEAIRGLRSVGEAGADWPNDEIDQALLRLAYCDGGSATPLVLELLERTRRGDLERSELLGCLQDLTSFLVRRSITKDSAKAYNNRLAEASRRVNAPVRETLWQDLHAIGWPSDEACMEAIVRHRIYTSDPGKARLILEELERASGTREPVQLARLQIEHVLPQTLSGEGEAPWRDALGAESDRKHAEFVDTLGNLTLTGWNVELSNHPYARKRLEYQRSPLKLNEAIARSPQWTPEEIEARSASLMGSFLERFPRFGTPVPQRRVAQRGAERANRSRRFWNLFLDHVEDLGGGRVQAVVGSKPNLTCHTRYRTIVTLPWIDLRRQCFGIWIQFKGKYGSGTFEQIRPSLDRVRASLASDFVLSFTISKRPRLELPTQYLPSGTETADSEIARRLAEYFLDVRARLDEALDGLGLPLRSSLRDNAHLWYRWNRSLIDTAKVLTPLHAESSCGYGRTVFTNAGFPGGYFSYLATQKSCRIRLTIERMSSDERAHQRRFDHFHERRAEIEAVMGPLTWSRDDSISYARISQTLEGGSGADEADWPEIQTRLAKAMIKFHETLSPIIESDEFRAI